MSWGSMCCIDEEQIICLAVRDGGFQEGGWCFSCSLSSSYSSMKHLNCLLPCGWDESISSTKCKGDNCKICALSEASGDHKRDAWDWCSIVRQLLV